MREIEYRAQDIETGSWKYGYLREICAGVNGKRRFTICPALNFAYNGFSDLDETEIIPETIGEYTGLKDRNDVKIFKGDIVLRCHTDSNGNVNREKRLVLFENGCFLMKRPDRLFKSGLDPNGIILYNDYLLLKRYTEECPELNGYFEVIGNIHDGPELLEEI